MLGSDFQQNKSIFSELAHYFKKYIADLHD